MGKQRNRPNLRRTSGATLGILLSVSAGTEARADAIQFWNQQIQSYIPNSGSANPTTSARDLAMLNVAMYDAVNAALGSPAKSYYPTGPVAADASAEAAADAAAFGILSQRFTSQVPAITAAYNSQLALLPNDQATAAGLTLGQNQASIVRAARANDNASAPSVFTPGSGPGQWQPTPPAHIPFQGANWANVTPFTMTSPNEFRPAGPPSLTSTAYAVALSEVQSIGAANSTTRTLDQTEAAEFWDADGKGGPAASWDEIALQVDATKHYSLLKDAQIFATLGVAQVDAFVASFDSKVHYAFWRPVTAIQSSTDPTWQPLLAAPPFASYAANHAAVPEAGATVLAALFGSDLADFSLTYDTDNSSAASLGNPTFGLVTRDFTSFSEAATETGMSRLWGGIHWGFDIDDGFTVGREVGLNAINTEVPEPASMALLITGVGALCVVRRRSQHQRSNRRASPVQNLEWVEGSRWQYP